MAKKRKTRSQKLVSDIRHQRLANLSISVKGASPALEPDQTKPKLAKPPSPPISAHSDSQEYSFVLHDLKKTSAITGAIILIELVLFFVVKL